MGLGVSGMEQAVVILRQQDNKAGVVHRTGLLLGVEGQECLRCGDSRNVLQEMYNAFL